MTRYKVGILSTHPIQYYSPWYRELARRAEIDLVVYYAHRATPADQARAGFHVEFEWDVPLLGGYRHQFLANCARRPGTAGYRGCDTPEIPDIIRRERFHSFVVHGWYTRSYWQAMRACWRTGTPLMVRGDSTLLMASGGIKRMARWFIHRRFLPRFDAYLVVGRRARDYYLAYGADPARMEFCPHFVDNEWFSQAAAEARLRRAELRQQWGLSQAAVVFLFAGKFTAEKRILDFIRGVGIAAREAPGISGLMVGDGPLRPHVDAAIKEWGAPITPIGFLNQTKVPFAYAAGDVLVLTSATETWGLVVNEAMACGLPALVSDRVGCAADLVTGGETGFAYPCGDVSALAAHMQRLAADPQLRERLGAAARRRIEAYSVEAAADGLCRALGRVAPRRRASVFIPHPFFHL